MVSNFSLYHFVINACQQSLTKGLLPTLQPVCYLSSGRHTVVMSTWPSLVNSRMQIYDVSIIALYQCKRYFALYVEITYYYRTRQHSRVCSYKSMAIFTTMHLTLHFKLKTCDASIDCKKGMRQFAEVLLSREHHHWEEHHICTI